MNWPLLTILFLADTLASGLAGAIIAGFLIGRYERSQRRDNR